MLKLFVSLFLIVKENQLPPMSRITASDICGNRCDTSYLAIREFPETNEDLQKICEPYIEAIECEIHKEEICQNHDPRLLQLGYRVLSTVREVCSEDTRLHTAVVDNLKCWNGKLRDQDNGECSRRDTQSDRVLPIAESLSEEGLVSLAENGSVTNNLYPCLGLMNFYACQSLVIEKACGTVAIDAYVEILQKVRPPGMYSLYCEEQYPLLPAVIRLRRMEEEKERGVAAFLTKRK